MLNRVQEDRAAETIGHLDDWDEMLEGNDDLDADLPNRAEIAQDEHHLIDVIVPRRRRRPYISRVAREIKVEFGTPEFTRANQLAVRRKAVQIMRDHRVRTSHQAAMIDEIVSMVFVPSGGELRAKELLASVAARRRREEANTDWHNALGRSVVPQFLSH